jgi:hypothetical protein
MRKTRMTRASRPEFFSSLVAALAFKLRAAMADDTSRWNRVNATPPEKPAFSARQSTHSLRQPTDEPQRRARRHSRGRSGKSWFLAGVIVLTLLTGILAWQLFAP